MHLLDTGQLASQLDLSVLKSLDDFGLLPEKKEAFRGPWLVGFGWDETLWPEKRPPTKDDLDRFFPTQPVYFSRCDGHSGVTNSAGLKLLGKSGDGLFRETDHYRNLECFPLLTASEIRHFLLAGARRFNAAGFTHVRDMAGNSAQWQEALKLERESLWTLHVDWNFTCETLQDFDRALAEAISARKQNSELNKAIGIKFYFDGSLGSETAFLSKPYANRTDGSRGMTCWPEEDVEVLLKKTWEAGLEVAVHTIGDEAVDRIVTLARKVSAQGFVGRLNLEHAQMVRPETLTKMKPLHVICHLQPCHWLTDRRWLKEKLGALAATAFPWEALRRAQIPFQFGSDSPIERPSYTNNLRALRESAAEGISPLKDDPAIHHVHSGPSIGETLFEGDLLKEVRLKNRLIFSASNETESLFPGATTR